MPNNRMLLRLAQATAALLETKQEELRQISWQDGEANTESGFSRLACACAQEAWASVKAEFPEFAAGILTATSPDITLRISENQKVLTTGKIELKSGVPVAIPGSTIGKLDINQPVIYCKRGGPEAVFELFYSQYHQCMGQSDTDLFQDRTPRPFVSCERMSKPSEPVAYAEKEKDDWTEHYAKCALNRVSRGFQGSWQDTFMKKIKEELRKEILQELAAEGRLKP